ncbi:hypothetical protein DNK47_03210 [Mycoplasma wenyonii]|uniref:Uncharacterized protein n=1 Tax=Mycoplasma wenyonii TaxID=65123 RepID=A0A328PR24_9MOLU|nr:hypothetical protein [Mycoplasma wenyonii]RAO94777.1 hypothetical protein DNK47_03210 [Mycoplasma wenyonii]
MDRRAKLGLCGLGFLSISGILLFTLENNFHSLGTLANLSLGGAFLAKNELSRKEQDLKLDFSKKGDPVSISFPKQVTPSEVKLELKNESQLEIPSEPFNYSPEDSISGIFQEIQKENKVIGIEKQVQENFHSLTQEVNSQKSHWTNFREVKRDVKEKWLRIKNKLSSLTDTQRIPGLTSQKRRSLMEIYKLYKKLRESRGTFLNQFQDLREEIDIVTATEPKETTSNILVKPETALRWIGWGSSGRVMLEKSGTPYKDRFSNNWGPWEKNPYANFYENQEEFEKDLDFVNRLRERIKQQINNLKQQQQWSRGRDRSLLGRINTFTGFLSNNFPQKHIEIKVAEKLLEHMGQLN